ncbi:hypothetical protein N656DRAFT_797985 [Canariomyces notabilis]|uniref:Endonuclease/exonuclease/phosphatase domain-containing protein n=1 Tax=Canariomyces notabilis TaxID=2074819 RepID=A0AAN6YTN9_9PEZI|nr:hypothetical protein N656DRAFT_797985 [Canariomyces arenarius]
MGDFNLRHPLWDLYERYEREAEGLVQLATSWDLYLVTLQGTITREPQGTQRGRPSTIDLVWASSGLTCSYYGVKERRASDHYPQVVEVLTDRPPDQAPPPWVGLEENGSEESGSRGGPTT